MGTVAAVAFAAVLYKIVRSPAVSAMLTSIIHSALHAILDRDDGMVTAELAVCLPVLVLLLAVALGAVSVASTRIRVADLAPRSRATSGTWRALRVSLLRSDARDGPAIHIVIARSIDEVTATASAKVGMLGSSLSAVTVTATSVAALEPADSPP